MKLLPSRKKPELPKTEMELRREREQASLDHFISTEWRGRETQFRHDVSLEQSRLEAEGFSPDFTYKFQGFMDLMRFCYHEEITGFLYPELMRQFKEYNDRKDAPMLFRSRAVSPDHDLVELFSALPRDEWYKMQIPYYTITRGAKELIKASPIGDAIAQYRQAHPFPTLPTLPVGAVSLNDVDVTYSEREVRRLIGSNLLTQVERDETRPLIDRKDFHLLQAHSRFGLQTTNYVPLHLFGDHLRFMQADVDYLARKPYLHGSDAGEGDYFYAAFELLEKEGEFFKLVRTTSTTPDPDHTWSALNLITTGNVLPHFYARKFIDAKKKVEKYGVESLGKYFLQEAVGENGRDGKLRLFQPNIPAQRKYRHYGDE